MGRTVLEVNGKNMLVALAVGVLLLLGFSDCMSAMPLDEQSMHCCGSMPCTPANHSHGCCKHMTSPETPNILRASHASVHPPAITTIEYPRILTVVWQTSTSQEMIETQYNSPPDLYTLHGSLLI